MHSEALLVTRFTSLDSKIYLKPNLGAQKELYGQNIYIFFLKKFNRTDIHLKTL